LVAFITLTLFVQGVEAPALFASCGEQSLTQFFNAYPTTFTYSDTLLILVIGRSAAKYSVQWLLTERKMVSVNTSHSLSSKRQQALIVKCYFWNTMQTKLSSLPGRFELREQASLSVTSQMSLLFSRYRHCGW